MSGRARRSADTHARIVTAARALFARDGYDATTIRAIATHANVSVGSVMSHCESKVHLLLQLFTDDLTAVIAGRPWCDDVDVHTALLDQFVGFLAHYADNPNLARAYVKETLFAPLSARAGYDALTTTFLGSLADGLARHAAAFRTDFAPAAVATEAFALYLAYVIVLLRDDTPDLAASVHALDHALAGLIDPLRGPR